MSDRQAYWDAWTGSPRWVAAARTQAEGRVAQRRLSQALLHPFGWMLDRLAGWVK